MSIRGAVKCPFLVYRGSLWTKKQLDSKSESSFATILVLLAQKKMNTGFAAGAQETFGKEGIQK